MDEILPVPKKPVGRASHGRTSEPGPPLPFLAMLAAEPRVCLDGRNFASQHCRGGGARNAVMHVEKGTHVASVHIGVLTGNISSIHSTQTHACLGVVEGLEMRSCTRGMGHVSQA